MLDIMWIYKILLHFKNNFYIIGNKNKKDKQIKLFYKNNIYKYMII